MPASKVSVSGKEVGLVGWLCGVILLGCSARTSHVRVLNLSPCGKTATNGLPTRRLALEEILSWRKYAYLVGMTEEQVTDILGEPRDRSLWGDGVHLTFENAKLDNRLVTLFVVDSNVAFVEVYPKPDEVFDISELVANADQFAFTSGIEKGETKSFLAATKNNLSIMIMTKGPEGCVYTTLSCVRLH
jgi:hypothetical protein